MSNPYQNAYNDPYANHTPAPPLPRHQYLSPSPTPTVNRPLSVYSDNDFEKKDRKHDDVEIGRLEDATASKEKKKKRMENRNCCSRCLCCACCLPAWAAGIIWFIIIAIIIVVIVIGSIAGTFVMPTVDLADVTSLNNTSQISFSGNTLDINFGLIVSINNPNLLSIELSDMKAIAYYPNPNTGTRSQIGTGYLDYQFVPTYSNFNFTFPFAIQYNPSIDLDQSMLNDIVAKCGLTGEEKQPLTVDYTINLAASVLSIKIHTSISSTATFDCPLDSETLGGSDNGGLSNLVNSK